MRKFASRQSSKVFFIIGRKDKIGRDEFKTHPTDHSPNTLSPPYSLIPRFSRPYSPCPLYVLKSSFKNSFNSFERIKENKCSTKYLIKALEHSICRKLKVRVDFELPALQKLHAIAPSLFTCPQRPKPTLEKFNANLNANTTINLKV